MVLILYEEAVLLSGELLNLWRQRRKQLTKCGCRL